MMVAPPKLAERLLRWSLPEVDRDVVPGDLQEEFGALADQAGLARAEGWYWQQTVLSIGPNLARRMRQHRIERKRLETEEDREARLKGRKWGGIMLALGIPMLILAVDGNSDFGGITSVVLVLFGSAGFFGSFAPRRPRDAFAKAVAQRRSNLFWMSYLLLRTPEHIVGKSHLIGNLELVQLFLGATILFWPRKYWIFGASLVLRAPQIRTPFIGSHRAPDGSLSLTVDAPQSGVSIGDPIVARAGEPTVRLTRTFSSADGLRVFAAIGEGAEPPTATLDVLDSSGVVRASSGVQLRDVEIVPAKAPWRRPRIPLAQVDEVVSLCELPPGNYQLRLTVVDSERRAEKYADFRVAEP